MFIKQSLQNIIIICYIILTIIPFLLIISNTLTTFSPFNIPLLILYLLHNNQIKKNNLNVQLIKYNVI